MINHFLETHFQVFLKQNKTQKSRKTTQNKRFYFREQGTTKTKKEKTSNKNETNTDRKLTSKTKQQLIKKTDLTNNM